MQMVNQKLVDNVECLRQAINHVSKIYLYTSDALTEVTCFLKLFNEKMEVEEIKGMTEISLPSEKIIIVNAHDLKKILLEGFNSGIYDESKYEELSKIRYSENNWEITVNGGAKLYILEKMLIQQIKKAFKKKEKKNLVVAFHIIDHCNLNCQMCNKFSPLAKDNYIEASDIIKDAERLSVLTDGQIKKIVITGGEPLLHPQLAEILSGIHNVFPNVEIQLQTNGLLLKNKDVSFFELCKATNTFFWITVYPIKFDYESLIRSIKVRGCGVALALEEEKTSWKMGLDIQGTQEKFWYIFCWMHAECVNLVNGKIYPCGLLHASRHFEEFFGCKFQRSEKDCLDIYKVDAFEKIADFLTERQPFCSYCDIKHWKKEIQWQPSRKSKDEWV